MKRWIDLTPTEQQLAQRTLTLKELDAWKLSLGGAGYYTVARALNISKDTARDRIRRARRKIRDAQNREEAA